ncbi:MAG: dethiobiotin synthase [Actinomycetota bacterium]|nr:dethiobiotin synthase [Actinomycetota bacterium]
MTGSPSPPTPIRGVVVSGTDTAVGKTVVAAALARCWADGGDDVVYVKPVQSGVADGDDDAATVRSLTGLTAVCGPRIGPAVAPAVGARLAGRQLTRNHLLAAPTAAAADHPGAALVVEGAGGLLVELGTDGTTVVDVAAALKLPVVVVARPGLGTLNHTALTVEALAARGVALAGLVVCGYPPEPDLATRTNLAELHRLSPCGLSGVVPQLDLAGDPRLGRCGRWFAPELGGVWDRSEVLAAAHEE